MELTKRQALEICRDLWDWLAENPTKHKWDWPRWSDYEHMKSYCPCCEYVRQQDSICEQCSLINYWPDGCLAINSPYRRWESARSDSRRSMFAKRIANYARKALKEVV